MNERRPRIYVYRGAVPLWLVLAVAAPLGLVLLTSLVLAVAIVGAAAALAALILPWFWKRPSVSGRAADGRTIELDRSQYRRIEAQRPRDRQ